jgi:hypothetical protein
MRNYMPAYRQSLCVIPPAWSAYFLHKRFHSRCAILAVGRCRPYKCIAKKEHYLLVSDGMRFTIVKACRQVLSALQ